jgi:hypothetical protein
VARASDGLDDEGVPRGDDEVVAVDGEGGAGYPGVALTVPVTAGLLGNVSPVNYELSLATGAHIAA